MLLWVSDRGKADVHDWSAMQQYIADGYDVVSFDGRGAGETRMRYTAMSIDDPTLAQQDFDRAYASPLSGVLANYVYNSLLTGRPYLIQMIEDVEIAARFARMRLNATDISITATGDAYTLAHDAADVLPGLRLLPTENAHVLSWAQLVREKQEVWPIQVHLAGRCVPAVGADQRTDRGLMAWWDDVSGTSRSSSGLAPAAWAKCTKPATLASTASSPSRSSRPTFAGDAAARSVCSAKPASSPL